MHRILNISHLPIAAVCILYLVAMNSILGNYQNHNGDYAQYFIHARNILLGRPWNFLLENYGAVLPGFPLLLLPIIAISGIDFAVLATIHVGMVLTISLIAYYLTRRILQSTLFAFLVGTAFLLNSYLMAFQQDAQPNLFFSFAVACVLFAFQLHSDNPSKWRTLALVLVLPLPGLIRLEAIALYAALLVARPIPNLKWCLYLLVLIALPITISKTISHTVGMVDYGMSQSISNIPANFNELIALTQQAMKFFLDIPVMLASMWLGTKFSVGAALFLVFGLLGLYPLYSRSRHLVAYLFAHLGILFIFTLIDPVLPPRYLLPITWVWILATFTGIKSVLGNSDPKKLESAGLIAILLIVFYPLLSYQIRDNATRPERKNYYKHPDVEAVFDYTAKHYPEKAVGFYKSRVATLLLDERGVPNQAIGIRSAARAIKHYESGGVMVVLQSPAYGNIAMYQALSKKCAPAFSSRHHFVFVKHDGCSS